MRIKEIGKKQDRKPIRDNLKKEKTDIKRTELKIEKKGPFLKIPYGS